MRYLKFHIPIFSLLILFCASNCYADTSVLTSPAIFVYYMFFPIFFGVLACIPKLIYLTNLKNEHSLLDDKKVRKEIIKEIIIITAIFCLSLSISKNISLSIINSIASINTSFSLILFKMYLSHRMNLLFPFFICIIFSLPFYLLLVSFLQENNLYLPGKKLIGSINAISMPLTACILIIIFSLLGGPDTNAKYFTNPSKYFVKNYKDIDMMLIHASDRGIPSLIEALIKNGADVNFNSEIGYTPLFASFGFGHMSYDRYNSVKILIKYGADVNAKNENGRPAIVELAYKRNIDLLKLLIDSGADITAKDKSGKTYKDYVGTNIFQEDLQEALQETRMSSKYIKGRELIKELGIAGWVLVEYAKKEKIQPYSNNGKRVYDNKIRRKYQSRDEYILHELLYFKKALYSSELTAWSSEVRAIREIQDRPQKGFLLVINELEKKGVKPASLDQILPEQYKDCVWEEFDLRYNPLRAKKIINRCKGYWYLKSDVEKLRPN